MLFQTLKQIEMKFKMHAENVLLLSQLYIKIIFEKIGEEGTAFAIYNLYTYHYQIYRVVTK